MSLKTRNFLTVGTTLALMLFASGAWAELKYAEEINLLREEREKYISIASEKFHALRRYNHYMERIVGQLQDLKAITQQPFTPDPNKSENANKLGQLFHVQIIVNNALQKIALLESGLSFEFDQALGEAKEFPELRDPLQGKKESILSSLNLLKASLLKRKDETEAYIKEWHDYNIQLALASQVDSLEGTYREREFAVSLQKIKKGVGDILREFSSAIRKEDYQRADDFLNGLTFIDNHMDQFFIGKLITDRRVRDYQLLKEYIAEKKEDMTSLMKEVIKNGYLNQDNKNVLRDLWDWFSGGRETRASKRSDQDLRNQNKGPEEVRDMDKKEKRTVRVTRNTRDNYGRINGFETTEFEIDTSERKVREKSVMVMAKNGPPVEVNNSAKHEKFLAGNSRRPSGPENVIRIEKEKFFEFPKKDQIKKDMGDKVKDALAEARGRFRPPRDPSKEDSVKDYLNRLGGQVQEAKKEFPDEAPDLDKLNQEVADFENLRNKYDNRVTDEGKEAAKIQPMVEELEKNVASMAPDFPEHPSPPLRGPQNPDDKAKELMRMLADLALGSTPPPLDTVYDFADFVAAMALGKSLLGEPVDATGKGIRGAALCLPFVSAGIITQGGNAIARLLEMMKAKLLTPEMKAALEKLYRFMPKPLVKILGNSNGNAIPGVFFSFKEAGEKLGLNEKELKEFGEFLEKAVDDVEKIGNRAQEYAENSIKNLGPHLPLDFAKTFKYDQYYNRQLKTPEIFFRYHGINNRTGKKYTFLLKKEYPTEDSLRKSLAILPEWGVEITHKSKISAPTGTWVSEGLTASQKGSTELPGGDYQAIISNVPDVWIQNTGEAFK